MTNQDNETLLKRRTKALGPSYQHFYEKPIQMVRGSGTSLFDADGRKYLDAYNNVAHVGHCHPHVVAALHNQASVLNTNTRYLHDNIVTYAERLAKTFPGDLSVCMFVCTGSEANDLAMRIARSVTGNHGAIVLDNSYHGNSTLITELSTCEYPESQQPDFLATVEPPNTYRGTYRDGENDLGDKYANLFDGAIEKLAANGHKPAAFMCDMIFDTNGGINPPADYFKKSIAKIRQAGGLFIADEVQPGFGRTGDNMWGFQAHDIIPDIVTMGKPMGNGHPMACVVTTPEIAAEFAKKFHYFNTFGGNPVSAAVASAVLDVIENEDLQANAKKVGAYLKKQIAEMASTHPLIGKIHGKGLFLGVELVKDHETLAPATQESAKIRDLMKDEGVLIGVIGIDNNVLKIRPPMPFSITDADQLLASLDAVLSRFDK